MDADLVLLFLGVMAQAQRTGFHTRDEIIPEVWGRSMPPWDRNVHDLYKAVVGFHILLFHITRRKS